MKMRLIFIILNVLLFANIYLYSTERELNNPKAVQRVLILGNSIVKHKPAPAIGWKGNWGMAASVKDSDFVHILIRKIRKEKNNCKVRFMNIAVFERTYTTFEISTLKSLKDYKPDLIVIKISENVTDSSAIKDNFLGAYKKLIGYLDQDKNAVKVIVEGFWDKQQANKIAKQVAEEGKFDFVQLSDLSKDKTNMAFGKFENQGVAMHPSDQGMRLIANRIWAVINRYFTNDY